MARPSKSKIVLTPTEFDWISRQVRRRKEKADPTSKDKLVQEFLKLSAKFEEQELPANGEDLILDCSRQQLRIMQELATNTISALNDKLIPGYEAKGKPEYVSSSKELASLLTAMLSKIEASL